jgi:hypothetical protein
MKISVLCNHCFWNERLLWFNLTNPIDSTYSPVSNIFHKMSIYKEKV